MQDGSGPSHHEDLAIHAGVHDLPETVFRTLAQQADIVVADVHGFNGQAVRFFPMGDKLRLPEKG